MENSKMETGKGTLPNDSGGHAALFAKIRDAVEKCGAALDFEEFQ